MIANRNTLQDPSWYAECIPHCTPDATNLQQPTDYHGQEQVYIGNGPAIPPSTITSMTNVHNSLISTNTAPANTSCSPTTTNFQPSTTTQVHTRESIPISNIDITLHFSNTNVQPPNNTTNTHPMITRSKTGSMQPKALQISNSTPNSDSAIIPKSVKAALISHK
ncbi:hypothetical protein PIB30_082410 [Stylosanthes scabra]|uniref:Uncharacterized protein n=1 Tax=Stylosanthes scabra TaxID=79078 RepID=A0ABU6YR59_9FABA|nr:hypothetical protein [Stylosanthes scabra]